MFKSILYPSVKNKESYTFLWGDDTLNQAPHKHIKHFIYRMISGKFRLEETQEVLVLLKLDTAMRSDPGLYPGESWKFQKMESAQCLGQLVLLLCQREEVCFYLYPFWLCCFSLCPLSLALLPHNTVSWQILALNVSFIPSLQILDSCCELPPKPARLQAEQAWLPQVLTAGQVLHLWLSWWSST